MEHSKPSSNQTSLHNYRVVLLPLLWAFQGLGWVVDNIIWHDYNTKKAKSDANASNIMLIVISPRSKRLRD